MKRSWNILVLSLVAKSVFAQVEPITLHGNVNLSSESYSASGISGRRPANISRAVFRVTLNIYDQVQLPFEAYITTDEGGFRQPFNQFGVNPRLFNWLTLHGGYFSTRLSEYTFGDVLLLGGGFEAQPGLFRFSFLYGRSREAMEPDSVRSVIGEYKRMMWGGKIGFGSESSGFIDVNFLHAIDDTTSLAAVPAGVLPQENAVASLAFGFPLFTDALQLAGEVAVSAFSNDVRSSEFDLGTRIPRWLFTPRISSQVDGAARLSLFITPSSMFSLRLGSQWIGPGFTSLGYAQRPNDILDFTVDPMVRFFEGKLSVRVSTGLRFNNLRNNRIATTRRTLGSLYVSAQPSSAFGLDVSYSNYGTRSSPRNDTLRIENIAQSLTISPRTTFESFNGMSNVILSYSYQDFEDLNLITSAANQSATHVVSTTWALTFPSTLNLATTALWTSSKTPVLTTKMFNIGETVGHQFFEDKLGVSASLGYSIIRVTSSDKQLTVGVNVNYGTGGWGSFSLSVSRSGYTFGAGALQPSYSELQGSLNYNYGF